MDSIVSVLHEYILGGQYKQWIRKAAYSYLTLQHRCLLSVQEFDIILMLWYVQIDFFTWRSNP